jgi:prepilin signal peptidase PulO-like enzyme (type II secretory pathway)
MVFVVELMLVIAVYSILRKTFGKYARTIFLAVAVARLILDPAVFTGSFVTHYLTMLLIFIIVRNFIGEIGEELFRRRISPGDLRPGMMLDKPLELHADSGRQRIVPSVRGLGKDDIEMIRHAKTEIKYLYVQEILPFAPFIFAGVLVTFMLGGHGIVLF